ncbi:MAG: DegT/DnrJ/EryC1/StrS family aminotransferase [Gemmatimonadetes bacterium]|nr:DegT/DnrJ/EryC1/StrS family aminotransferase [Gemmatimonadota bacterium]
MRRVPMSRPDIGDAERDAVMAVLATPVLSIGSRIEAFEAGLARRLGVRHAAAVCNGTAGLHLALLAAGVGPGDEVLTTPFSFVASANAVVYTGATPVFVDVDPVTGNLDPSLLGAAVTHRSKAVLPVHVFGQPADMDPIVGVARESGLAVIEDACEAIGSTYKGRPAGALGDAAVLAFYPNKQMTTGEGGAILTSSAEWDSLYRSLRNQGRDQFDQWLGHSRLGFNYRLDEMSAALGVVQLRRLDELLAGRERVAAAYDARLAGITGVTPPPVVSSTTRMSWFVYVVRLDDGLDRDHVMRALERRGVPSRPYFPAIHLQRYYRETLGLGPGAFPVAERLARTSLALPFYGAMPDDEVDYVCECLESVVTSLTRAGV